MTSLVGITVYAMRVLVSTVLFTFFGYISPVLSSVKSIVNGDQDGMKEWVTYWVVQASLLYLETLLSAFQCFKEYPPELRVVCALWLTLPRFQGAYRIYTVLLQPYFEKYEDDIDRHVEQLAGHVRQRASRHLQTILWQLFLAPQDGLVAGLGIGSLLQGGGLALAALQGGPIGADTSDSPRPAPAAPGLTPTRAAIQRQLLDETSKLLAEGICVFAGRHAGLLAPCQLTLLEAEGGKVNAGVLQITVLEGGEGWSVPLHEIAGMDLLEEEEEGSVICLHCQGGTRTFVREEEAEGGETEALLAGLRTLVASARGPRMKAVRTEDKGEGKGEGKGEERERGEGMSGRKIGTK